MIAALLDTPHGVADAVACVALALGTLAGLLAYACRRAMDRAVSDGRRRGDL